MEINQVSLALSYLRDCGAIIKCGLSIPGGHGKEAEASRIALRRAARSAVDDCRGEPPAALVEVVCSPN